MYKEDINKMEGVDIAQSETDRKFETIANVLHDTIGKQFAIKIQIENLFNMLVGAGLFAKHDDEEVAVRRKELLGFFNGNQAIVNDIFAHYEICVKEPEETNND